MLAELLILLIASSVVFLTLTCVRACKSTLPLFPQRVWLSFAQFLCPATFYPGTEGCPTPVVFAEIRGLFFDDYSEFVVGEEPQKYDCVVR